jgi:hypothetical protein
VFATHKEYQDKVEALGFEFRQMRPDNTALNDSKEMARMMDSENGHRVRHQKLGMCKLT